MPFALVKDTNLRQFQFRVKQRILGTNSLLCKMGLRNDNKCSFYNREKETIKHLFLDCRYAQDFGGTVILLLVDSYVILYLETQNPTNYLLNKIVLLGSKYIYLRPKVTFRVICH